MRVILAFLLSLPVQAQILSPILSNVTHGGGGSSINTTPVQVVHSTLANNVSVPSVGAHHLLVAWALNDNGTGVMSGTGCSDGTNTWQLPPGGTVAGAFYSVSIAYAMDTTAGSYTATCPVSGTSSIYVVVKEYAGASLIAALDVLATGTVLSTDCGTLTTALANELLEVGHIGATAQTPTGYTQDFTVLDNSMNQSDHKAAGAAGSYTAASCSVTNVFQVGLMAAFK